MFGNIDYMEDDMQGIIPRTAHLLFQKIALSQEAVEYAVQCQMVEIYGENIRDLLNGNDGLKVKTSAKGGIYIDGCTTVPVTSISEMFEVFHVGNQAKHI